MSELVEEARKFASSAPYGKSVWREFDKSILLIRKLADALEASESRLDGVAGVAASSIPDMSLRGKPMAAVVALSVTLSAAERERDEARAEIAALREGRAPFRRAEA